MPVGKIFNEDQSMCVLTFGRYILLYICHCSESHNMYHTNMLSMVSVLEWSQ